MDETRIVGRLPNLDIEIMRREAVGENAEIVTITMKATPSFDAVGNLLMGPGFASLPAAWTASPWMAWAEMMQTAWRPWLSLMGASPLLNHLGGTAAPGRNKE